MARPSARLRRIRRSATLITLIYAVMAVAWLALATVGADWLMRNSAALAEAQLAMGLVLIAGTSLLIWLLLRRALQRIGAGEQRYRALFESSQDAMFVVDHTGRFLDANAAAMSMAGYDLRQLEDRSIATMLRDAAGQPTFGRLARQLAEQPAGTRAEHFLQPRTGAPIQVEVAIKALQLDDLAALVCIVRDISVQRAAQVALEQSEARFRQLFEAAPVGIATSSGGKTTSANRAYLALFGYTAEDELLGTPLLNQIAPEQRAVIAARNRRREADDVVPTTYETVGLRRDGSTFALNVDVANLHNSADARTLVFATDVSARKQTEEAIRAAEQRLRAVISNAPLVLFALDASGTITMVEGQGLQALGLAPDTMVGRSVFARHADLPAFTVASDSTEHPASRALRGEAHTTRTTIRGRSFEIQWTPVADDGDAPTGVIGVATDVTERIAADTERHQLAAVVENSADTIGISTLDGKVTYLNPAGQRLLGLTVEQARATTVADYFTHDDYDMLAHEIVPAIVQDGGWYGEFRIRNFQTGTPIPVELNAFLIRDQQTGRALAFANVTRDISARKQAEATLRVSESTTRALLHAIPDLMFRVDRQGIFRAYESRSADRLALPPTEFLGRHIADVMPPNIAQPSLTAIAAALASDEPQIFEYQLPTPSGIGDFEARVVPCADDEVLCIIREISERKRMERSIRDAEARQQAILNGTTDGISLKDTAGRYMLINPAQARFFRRPEAEIIGRTDWELLPRSIAEQLVASDRAVLEGGKSIETEDDLVLDGRQQTFLAVKAPYIVADGTVQGVIGVTRDITERKRHEQIKDDFLALASHELKTPLASVMGYIHLLERWSEKQGFGPRVDQALVAMHDESRRLDRLINDLLDVSRIQTGRLQLHLRLVELRSFVTQSIATLRLAISDHPIVASLPSTDVCVALDSQRFEQVLANLLTNAAKYSHPNEPIYVEMRALADHVEIAVRDTGLGIPADDLPFIFDRFYQVVRPPRESRPGMGLGLFITQEIVRQHGGTLEVESREHRGSRFTIRLPYDTDTTKEVSADANGTPVPSS